MRTDSAPEEEEAHLEQRTELPAEVAEVVGVIDQVEFAVALAEVRAGSVVYLVG